MSFRTSWNQNALTQMYDIDFNHRLWDSGLPFHAYMLSDSLASCRWIGHFQATLDRTLDCQDLLDSEIDPHNLTHCNSLFDGVVLRGYFQKALIC